ncbi:MAG: alpha/beta hydrolase [Anaerolineales bacterium]|nr:alpha/beta hydrolase [Anaerolineales bacterium]NUQ85772.1 alpha/beta hydrolase [Anaerolineales bacterium]
MNDQARSAAGGSFIPLADGITHYELSNDSPLPPEEGSGAREVVVLVHGFSVPYFIFDPTFAFLTQNGFRTLRYDLFGRGYSDRPRARYDIDLFVGQLHDLLDALRLSRPVNLIGLSMGGAIAATFAARHPERVKTLTLIDPAGAKAISLTPLLKAMKLPGIAEAVFGLVGSEGLLRSAAKDFFDPELIGHFLDRYKIQMQYRGFKRAILSSVRNHMLGSFIESYRNVGKMDKPVLLVWGRNDTTVPLAHSDLLRDAMPQAEFHVIEECGHIPHYEKPDEFNPILLNFLSKGV